MLGNAILNSSIQYKLSWLITQMKNKVISENLRVISDDNRTVKIGHDSSINFKIFDHHETQLIHVSLSSTSTVGDLMKNIKQKLSAKKFPVERILCLESMDNQQVLDYSLLLDQYELSNFHNHQSFKLVIEQQVISEKWVSLNDFIFKKCLGQGASANVCLVRHKGNGKLYALKQIEKNYFVEFKRMQQVLREKKIMTEIVNDFPFCAKLYASFQSEKHLNFLLEFYPGGEMFFHLHKRRLTENQAKLYFAEMTLTFEFLHEQKVVYRDLKPQNIMIDFHGHARLTDFGLCKINLNKEDLTNSYCGSIEYMAPQVKDNIGYNYSVDFYTLGAFLYEMVMGVPPYYNSQSLYFSETSTSHYKNLVKGLIENSVQMRISSFKQIRSNKWMSDVKWEQIKHSSIKMPFNVSPYETYIHDEFKNVSVEEYNSRHEQKYDRLFHFFTYFKNDRQNANLLKFYRKSSINGITQASKRSTSGMSNSSSQKKDMMKKKFVRDRSIRENSRSKDSKFSKKSKGQNSKNSSRTKTTKMVQTNIYLKKNFEDHLSQRSKSPKNQIVFKKSSNLKAVKSSKDLLKHTLTKL